MAALASAAILLIYLAVILSTIKLKRKKQDVAEKTFRIPGGLLIPVIGMASIVWLLTSLSISEIFSMILFISVICVIYFITRKYQRKKIVLAALER